MTDYLICLCSGGGADYTIKSSDGGSSGVLYPSGSSGSSYSTTSPVYTYNAGTGGTLTSGGTAGSLGQGGSGGCVGGSLTAAAGAGGELMNIVCNEHFSLIRKLLNIILNNCRGWWLLRRGYGLCFWWWRGQLLLRFHESFGSHLCIIEPR